MMYPETPALHPQDRFACLQVFWLNPHPTSGTLLKNPKPEPLRTTAGHIWAKAPKRSAAGEQRTWLMYCICFAWSPEAGLPFLGV